MHRSNRSERLAILPPRSLTARRVRGLHVRVNGQPHKFSEEKLQQVILYFLEHINNVHLGRTKLMKLLYFVDFDHYEAHGQFITGATYRKLPHGPYPDKIERVIGQMEKAGMGREGRRERKDYDH